MSLKVQVYISVHLLNVLVGEYFGRGVLAWDSRFRSSYDWVVRWEGSSSLSKSLYLGRTDNGLQIYHERSWEPAHSVI